MWTNGAMSPILDESQDFFDHTGKIEDGILTIKFSRSRNTNDKIFDVAFTDDTRKILSFPTQGIIPYEKTSFKDSIPINFKTCYKPEGKS